MEVALLEAESKEKGLRVLYIDYSVGFGGAIKSFSLMLRHLPGVEPLILTAQDQEIIDIWLPSLMVRPFRRVLNYRTTWRVGHWVEERLPAPLAWVAMKSLAVANRVAAVLNFFRIGWLIRRYRIDLLHLNNGFGLHEAIYAADLMKIPCVVHLRDFEQDHSRARQRAMGRVAHVIAISGAVADSLRDTAVPSERIEVIHNPVDLDRASSGLASRESVRSTHGLSDLHTAVGIFGRIIEWKGHAIFVEAMIRAMREDQMLRAVIVGDESDGDRDYFDGIREKIQESGFADRFVLTGYRPNVEEYYGAVDLVVHASITPEPFGRVIVEAMAAGRAIIAADAGGPTEIITQGDDGLLVPPGDVEALAAAILGLAADPIERERLARNGYQTAKSRFSIEANAAAVRALYDRVLAKQPSTDVERRHKPGGHGLHE